MEREAGVLIRVHGATTGDGVLACSVYKTGAEGARVLSFLVREVGLKDDKANKQQETALHIAVSLTIRRPAHSFSLQLP